MPRAALLTGYGPYGRERSNPSGIVARRLDGRVVGGFRVQGVQIPVAVTQAGPSLERLLESVEPSVALATGVAPGRSTLSVERVALNVLDFSSPDNRGRRYRDRPIRKDGPAAYLSTLPVRPILRALRQAGIPATLSNSAGTYLCNFAMYTLLDGFARRGWGGPAGFVHLPQTPEESVRRSGQPSMSLDVLERGILLALAEAVRAARSPGSARRPSRRA